MSRIFGQYFSAEMAFLCLIEWALTSIVLYSVLISATEPGISIPLGHANAGSVALMQGLTIGAVAVVIGLYRPEICLERGRLLSNAGMAGVLAFPALLLVSETLDVDLNVGYLLWLGKGLVAWVAFLLVSRWIFSFAIQRRLFVRRVMVVGTGREAARTREQIQLRRGRFFEVVTPEILYPRLDDKSVANALNMAEQGELADNLPADGKDWLARARAARIWGIVVSSDQDNSSPANANTVIAFPLSDVAEILPAGQVSAVLSRNTTNGLPGLSGPALLDLKLRGIRVFDDMNFWEQHLGRINLDRLDAQWLTYSDGFSSSRLGAEAKRIMDILVSLAVLVLTLPLMLITALLIKLDNPGPIFYRQERVGLHGRPFTLFKFRSMSVDAEAGGRPRWASQKDPRVTRVGGFIRSTRIDELPQLLNVLRGEMSFVGPRPERPHFVEQLAEIIPFYHERSYVKPGITGWAQVNFPYGASVEDAKQKLSYDLYYAKNRSLILDIVILFSTIRVILFREGAR